MPEFTRDWFSNNIPGLNKLLGGMRSKDRFLEIGSFEGMSACWFLQNHLSPNGTLVCIDTFQGGAEHVETKFEGVEARCRANIEEVRKPGQTVEILAQTSGQGMAKLLADGRTFDFIYVDGSHESPDVMLDACLAYQLVDEGGVIVFDDYLWDLNRPLLDTPKMALDMFTTLYREKVSIVMMNFQLAVVKIK